MTQGYTKGVPIDTDPTLSANSNQLVPSQAAVVTYVGARTDVLTSTVTAGQILRSSSSAPPVWSTSTYPASNAANTLLYASAANTMSALPTANNSVLSTDASGVPSIGTSLTNDYTYTSATAGATRTLTVTNTDNSNAASAAIVKIATGGASAGDASVQLSTTTTNWSLGVDNSVTTPTADTFVISQGAVVGTNNIMSAATSGEINYPLQPAFLAYNQNNINDVTGDGTNYTAVFATEVFDQNSDYSSPNFTAPVTGRYYLSASVGVGNVTGTSFIIGHFAIVTSNRNYPFTRFSPSSFRNTVDFTLFLAGSFLCDMDAGDTANVYLGIAGGTKTIVYLGQTGAVATGPPCFSGYLSC
jgi:hypothetical protein